MKRIWSCTSGWLGHTIVLQVEDPKPICYRGQHIRVITSLVGDLSGVSRPETRNWLIGMAVESLLDDARKLWA